MALSGTKVRVGMATVTITIAQGVFIALIGAMDSCDSTSPCNGALSPSTAVPSTGDLANSEIGSVLSPGMVEASSPVEDEGNNVNETPGGEETGNAGTTNVTGELEGAVEQRIHVSSGEADGTPTGSSRSAARYVAYDAIDLGTGPFVPLRMAVSYNATMVEDFRRERHANGSGFWSSLAAAEGDGAELFWARRTAYAWSVGDFQCVFPHIEEISGTTSVISMDRETFAFPIVSLGVRRTRFQGTSVRGPRLIPVAFPLEVGESLDIVPPSLLSYAFPFEPYIRGSMAGDWVVEAQVNVRRFHTIVRVRGCVSIGDVTSNNSLDRVLLEADAPTIAQQRMAPFAGLPEAWVFEVAIRHHVDIVLHGESCPSCEHVMQWAKDHDDWCRREWSRRVKTASQGACIPPNERELPVLNHIAECPFGGWPIFRRPLFIGPSLVPCARGDMGWIIEATVDVAMMVPSNFLERRWVSTLFIDALFPFERHYHQWLGSFVRLSGFLRMSGYRVSRRGPITFEWIPTEDDMAGLQNHIRLHAWSFRPRAIYGARHDIQLMSIALQVTSMAPWRRSQIWAKRAIGDASLGTAQRAGDVPLRSRRGIPVRIRKIAAAGDGGLDDEDSEDADDERECRSYQRTPPTTPGPHEEIVNGVIMSERALNKRSRLATSASDIINESLDEELSDARERRRKTTSTPSSRTSRHGKRLRLRRTEESRSTLVSSAVGPSANTSGNDEDSGPRDGDITERDPPTMSGVGDLSSADAAVVAAAMSPKVRERSSGGRTTSGVPSGVRDDDVAYASVSSGRVARDTAPVTKDIASVGAARDTTSATEDNDELAPPRQEPPVWSTPIRNEEEGEDSVPDRASLSSAVSTGKGTASARVTPHATGQEEEVPITSVPPSSMEKGVRSSSGESSASVTASSSVSSSSTGAGSSSTSAVSSSAHEQFVASRVPVSSASSSSSVVPGSGQLPSVSRRQEGSVPSLPARRTNSTSSGSVVSYGATSRAMPGRKAAIEKERKRQVRARRRDRRAQRILDSASSAASSAAETSAAESDEEQAGVKTEPAWDGPWKEPVEQNRRKSRGRHGASGDVGSAYNYHPVVDQINLVSDEEFVGYTRPMGKTRSRSRRILESASSGASSGAEDDGGALSRKECLNMPNARGSTEPPRPRSPVPRGFRGCVQGRGAGYWLGRPGARGSRFHIPG